MEKASLVLQGESILFEENHKMARPTVAISVDCASALEGRCYVPELVKVAEEFTIPLTWLLNVQEHDPMTNVKLYHNEYLHRIPSWHEIGLHLSFDTGRGNTVDRGDLIRVGKDILKQFSIKPTAFRAGNGDLEPGDLAALEDIGIVVDATPGSSSARPSDAPSAPYHPDYDHIHHSGTAKIWVAPIAHQNGVRGYLDEGFEKVQTVIDSQLSIGDYVGLGLSDSISTAETLQKTLSYLKGKGARFVSLTQLVSEL